MQAVIDQIFPDQCVLCLSNLPRREPHLCCQYCWAALPWLGETCLHCALPLDGGGVCGQCQQQPLNRGWCVAALAHEREAQFLLHRLKFQHGYREGHTLAHALLLTLHARYADSTWPTWIIPTPLSWWGFVRRSHNQAHDLATYLARRLNIPLHGVMHRRHGRPQRMRTAQERYTLSPDEFSVKTKVPAHVALVDDVLTTGSTATAITTQLYAHGARRVDIWCANRALATVPYEHAL